MGKKHFEGWYFKHQKEDETICFIVGRAEDKAFIQIITKDFSKTFNYALEDYRVSYTMTQIRIGESIFTKDGCIINIHLDDMIIRGRLSYGRLTMLKSDIMGIFRYVPWMECRHGVVSMDHNVTGNVEINGEKIDLTGGKGYIECDKGRSFPKWYLWCQCNSFETKTSVMIAVAKIPFLGLSFTGTISSVFYQGKEYRFATYLGARVLEHSSKNVVIKQGNMKLVADFEGGKGHDLDAPQKGNMTRNIIEKVNTHAHFKMFIEGEPLFNLQSENACLEYMAPAATMECVEPIEI